MNNQSMHISSLLICKNYFQNFTDFTFNNLLPVKSTMYLVDKKNAKKSLKITIQILRKIVMKIIKFCKKNKNVHN